mmetsp:Transcript_31425/g.91835  ORF Transcript_31425/g.91835 Transcript_31425/m.91835 type:complete len:256 (-) Transcript_31425:190-957(-)
MFVLVVCCAIAGVRPDPDVSIGANWNATTFPSSELMASSAFPLVVAAMFAGLWVAPSAEATLAGEPGKNGVSHETSFNDGPVPLPPMAAGASSPVPPPAGLTSPCPAPAQACGAPSRNASPSREAAPITSKSEASTPHAGVAAGDGNGDANPCMSDKLGVCALRVPSEVHCSAPSCSSSGAPSAVLSLSLPSAAAALAAMQASAASGPFSESGEASLAGAAVSVSSSAPNGGATLKAVCRGSGMPFDRSLSEHAS